MILQTNIQNSPFEVLHVNSKKVSCEGRNSFAGSSSSHPLVYLNMGEKNSVICPYCSKYFTIEKTSPSQKKK